MHTGRFVKTVLFIHIAIYNPINPLTPFHIRSGEEGGKKKKKGQFLIPELLDTKMLMWLMPYQPLF